MAKLQTQRLSAFVRAQSRSGSSLERLSLLAMACILLLFCAATAIDAPAQSTYFTSLMGFSGANGSAPYTGLVQGTDGNFYGTTQNGGSYNVCTYGCGTVFKITPSGTLTTLHSFQRTDGGGPDASLLQASDGNFYGTTAYGGDSDNGTVFVITPAGTLTTLHSFDGVDGARPLAGLVQGTDGDFYGTTYEGGTGNCEYGCGTVFKITPGGTLTTLHSFNGSDGQQPEAGLVQASDGNFYGTTFAGGAYENCNGTACGTLYKMTPAGTLTTQYSFCASGWPCPDGYWPFAGLVQGTDGNLYGTTGGGGVYGAAGYGTVFKITPQGRLTTLHSFDSTDGDEPTDALVQASDGNFYGTTFQGGARDFGTVFQITPAGTLTTLHSFTGRDGINPWAGLVQATDGSFYGTTAEGGGNGCNPYDGCGTVFRIGIVRKCTTCRP